jgi:hypothetical protein
VPGFPQLHAFWAGGSCFSVWLPSALFLVCAWWSGFSTEHSSLLSFTTRLTGGSASQACSLPLPGRLALHHQPPHERAQARDCMQPGVVVACLSSQCLGSCGRKIKSSRSAWAT